MERRTQAYDQDQVEYTTTLLFIMQPEKYYSIVIIEMDIPGVVSKTERYAAQPAMVEAIRKGVGVYRIEA